MTVHTTRHKYLLSAASAQGAGARADTRASKDYGYAFYQCSGASAVFQLQASHDLTALATEIDRTRFDRQDIMPDITEALDLLSWTR